MPVELSIRKKSSLNFRNSDSASGEGFVDTRDGA